MPLLLQCKPMPEEWRPVVGYEGLYEVSSLGRVRSLDRVIKGRNGKQDNLKGKLIKQRIKSKSFYCLVNLCKEGKVKTWFVHRLVAIAFLGLPPERHIVCHGPKGRRCNAVTNLYWGTYKQNNGPDMLRDGTLRHSEKSNFAKLNQMQVKEIRRLIESKTMTQRKIAAMFDISEATITVIKQGKTWQH